MRPLERWRRLGLASLLLGLSACAHRPVTQTPITKTLIPALPAANAPTTVAIPTVVADHAARPPDDYANLWDRLRAGFVLQEVQEPAIDEQLQWFLHNPQFLQRTFYRARLYLYQVVSQLEARGMPTEFALLPVVESAYQPFAYSPSRAAGMWQFIPATGRRFGLKQDWWFDGRRDVLDSTRAALDYFQQLHAQFGDWLLAIAAYNIGEVAIQHAVDENRAAGLPTDFWHLKLPAETRAYVPELLALKRLIADPERYGIDLPPIPDQPYFAVVHVGTQIDLRVAAKLAGTSYHKLVELNPGFNRWATDPDGPHRLLVPADDAAQFAANLKSIPAEDQVHYLIHTVRARETLTLLARHYGTTPAALIRLNGLHGWRLRAGETLRIPAASGSVERSVELAAARVDREGGGRSREFHGSAIYRVRRGDTLDAIARREHVPLALLARLNHLGRHDRIVAGQRLHVERVASRHRARIFHGRARLYASRHIPKIRHVHPVRRMTYRVRKGDTVYSIARQFQVSMQQLRHWNGLKHRRLIRTGQRLVLYVRPNRQEG